MALNAAQQWWIRSDGAETNGGGFDSTVSGAGTNYSDQASPQLSLSDLATTGAVATLTSVMGGFTSAMVGNIIRIASGTNFTAGYYTIITFTSLNTVVLDRACATGVGSGGVGKVGGAHASLVNYSNGGSGLASPAVGSPLAAGHTINWNGGGTSDPSGTVTWDHSAGYWAFPSGGSSGAIKLIGYNGRPFVGTCPLLIYTADLWLVKNISFKILATTYFQHGITGNNNLRVTHDSNYIDGNGKDTVGIETAATIRNCRFTSSGTAGTSGRPAMLGDNQGGIFIGNSVKNWRGAGIEIYSSNSGSLILNNIIQGCKLNGILIQDNGGSPGYTICGNTIYNNTGDGVKCSSYYHIQLLNMFNNIIANNSGYGFNANFGSAAANDLLKMKIFDYNNYYSNSSGAYNNISAGANDTALDPQFTNAGSDDFSVGANMKAIGFPGAFPLAGSTGYTDLGAVQRVEPSANSDIVGSRRLVPI